MAIWMRPLIAALVLSFVTWMTSCSSTSAAENSPKKLKYLAQQNLSAASDYSAKRRGYSLLVIQNGKTLWEDYPNGGSRDTPHKIFSGTKGFWNLAAMHAADQGLLDLDERVADTIPEWRDERGKSQITIRQLLDFSSGMDPLFHLHEDGISDRDAIAIKHPLVAAPGDAFIYGPGSLQVFHEVLRRKLASHGETPTHYLERHVLRPLGLGPQRYVADRSGNPLLAAGFTMTAREWSGMGKVLLHSGYPITNPSTFQACCHGPSANRAFSLGFWNNSNADRSGAREPDIEDMLELDWPKESWRGVCLCRDAPSDLIASVGSGYQRLFVIPSMDLIVVRQGSNAKFSDGEFLRLLLGL